MSEYQQGLWTGIGIAMAMEWLVWTAIVWLFKKLDEWND